MTDFNVFQSESVTGNGPVDQARACRLLIAAIEDDLAQFVDVGREVAVDSRGKYLAVWELVIGLAGGLSAHWLEIYDRDSVLDGLRNQLLEHERNQGA